MKVWLEPFKIVEERYFIQEVLAGCTIKQINCLRYYGYSETPEEKDERGNIYPSKPIIVMEKGKESLRDCLLKNLVDMKNRLIMINQIANGLYHIPYDQLVIDWNNRIDKGSYAEVYTGYIIQSMIDK